MVYNFVRLIFLILFESPIAVGLFMCNQVPGSRSGPVAIKQASSSTDTVTISNKIINPSLLLNGLLSVSIKSKYFVKKFTHFVNILSIFVTPYTSCASS